MTDNSFNEIIEGNKKLIWAKIWYLNGTTGRKGGHVGYQIKDPHTCGWSHAFVLYVNGKVDEDTNELVFKRCIIICPFTLNAYHVSVSAKEIVEVISITEEDLDSKVERLRNKWKECNSFGFQRGYDEVASLFQMLGEDIPEVSLDRVNSNKALERKAGKDRLQVLIRPLKKHTKRGMVLDFFLKNDFVPLRAAMSELGMSRSLVLSHLSDGNKYHGTGYIIMSNDTCKLTLPEGVNQGGLWVNSNNKKANIKASKVSIADIDANDLI